MYETECVTKRNNQLIKSIISNKSSWSKMLLWIYLEMGRCILRKQKKQHGVGRKIQKNWQNEPLRSSSRCILFLWHSFKTSHIPFSTTFPSRSFRPLRNTFRSIDFALDTQAVGTERRRSRKSARVKDKTGARLAERGPSIQVGRGKKRCAAAETRSRNKRVARAECGIEQKQERRYEEKRTKIRER